MRALEESTSMANFFLTHFFLWSQSHRGGQELNVNNDCPPLGSGKHIYYLGRCFPRQRTEAQRKKRCVNIFLCLGNLVRVRRLRNIKRACFNMEGKTISLIFNIPVRV